MTEYSAFCGDSVVVSSRAPVRIHSIRFEGFMIGISKFISKIVSVAVFIATPALYTFAQTPFAKKTPPADDSFLGSYGIYLGIFGMAAIGVAAIFYMRKREAASIERKPMQVGLNGLKPGELRMRYTESKKIKMTPSRRTEMQDLVPEPVKVELIPGFSKLPINSFVRLERTSPFVQLPESQDEDLLCAIEQTQEGSEEDAEIRGLSLKILAAFRTSNSVSAISQMALYDLSSKLRSNAVTVLAGIDHESVFESIVTACADPTREVRAAAARGLFRLNFDRAHAWTRIVETGDESRMRQAARAAMEGDLVERSFERLVHKDNNIAYEAYAVTALLIKAGETEPIYRTLAEHKEEDVKFALLHVLRTIRNETTFDSLSELLIRHELTPNVVAKINEVRSYSQLMNV